MTDSIIVRLEASHGCRASRGDRVERGQALGTRPDCGGQVLCPCNGRVTAVGFDATDHCYVMEIEPEKGE